MHAPSFWWRSPSGPAVLLAPLARLYGAITATRLGQPGLELGIPVVCIGNLTLGGAGKTPTAIAIAGILHSAGINPSFLSRGYGGRRAGPLMVDPVRHTAREVGDEPLLLARVAPTIVTRTRANGARYARSAGASLIIMDDGFQNPALMKHLAVLVVDGRRGIGNGKVFPAGPLRAPLEAQLNRAQAIIVVGESTGATPVTAAARTRGLPVFTGRLEPDRDALAALAGSEVLAFTGIGDPEKFFATLREAGVSVRGQRSFSDHHRYTRAEAAALTREAAQQGLTLITTEKDATRLRSDPRLASLAYSARTLPVHLSLHGALELQSFLLEHLARLRIDDARGLQR